MRIRPGAVLALATAAAACDPTIQRPRDAAADAEPVDAQTCIAAPTLEPLPPAAPYTVATVRGTARGAVRVIVEGSDNPTASRVLPDGTFCVDVRLPAPAAYTFSVFAQDMAGRLSCAPATTMQTYDPSAARIVGAQTCSGSDPAGCMGATENCSNGRDDDCDNLVDARDPDCVTCMDDALEPNDDANAPRIDPGRYENLVACPNNNDYYGIGVRAGDFVSVSLAFRHANGDIDMQLLDVDRTTVLERSTGVMDTESLSYRATRDGELKLRVYVLGSSRNTYSMSVRVTR